MYTLGNNVTLPCKCGIFCQNPLPSNWQPTMLHPQKLEMVVRQCTITSFADKQSRIENKKKPWFTPQNPPEPHEDIPNLSITLCL